jgi:predicted dehydrogenase
MTEPAAHAVGVGVIGAGMISDQYLGALARFPDVRVVMLSDLDVARAEAQAAKYGVPRFGTTDQLLTDSEVEIVVNLTIPVAHASVSSRALRAGKHVWSEKPLSVDRESGRALLEDAEVAGRFLAVAPDTIMGAGVQTAKRAIDRGDIGVPLSVTALFQFRGPDSFHPNPGFLFQPGAGPLFDIGPYYLTTFAYIFGSISDVAAVGQRARAVRRCEVGPQAGLEFQVEVPTEVRSLLRFESGATGQLLLSWDSPLRRMAFFEVTGTEGTIALPDPNRFDGDSRIIHASDDEWTVLPEQGVAAGRGSGVLELARASRAGRPPLFDGRLGYHVLDTMISLDESIEREAFVSVASTAPRVATLPADWNPFESTLEFRVAD